jgi:hypothetical protein
MISLVPARQSPIRSGRYWLLELALDGAVEVGKIRGGEVE